MIVIAVLFCSSVIVIGGRQGLRPLSPDGYGSGDCLHDSPLVMRVIILF